MYISIVNTSSRHHYYYTHYLLCTYTLYVFIYIYIYVCAYRYGAERRAEPEALSAEAANSNSVEGTAMPGTNIYHMIHVHD